MRVSKYDFDKEMTQDVVDEIVNGLLVNLHTFSEIACLDGMGYGVKTFCTDCNIRFNQCIRTHLVKALAAAQAKAEHVVGYPVTEQYWYYDEFWNGESIVQLKPGVASVNVRREFGDPVAIPISPYIQEDVPVEDSGDGFCIATLDKAVVDNPLKVILRTGSKSKIDVVEQNGYPKRDSSGNWMVIPKKVQPPECGGGPYHVQHCEYMTLLVPDSMVCGDGEEIMAFYPDSHQIIPLAKEPIVEGDNTRWWFYAWTLLDSAFQDEGADLAQAQFERLLTEIDFRCVSEVEALPQIVWLENQDCKLTYTTDDDLAVQIFDAKKGLALIDAAAFRCSQCSETVSQCNCYEKRPLRLRLYYKVSPEVFGMRGDMDYVRQAIAYLAAAELPDKACRCDVGQDGFIYEAKEPFNKVRTYPSGVTQVDLKYGTRYGQLAFVEKLKLVEKIYPPIRV